MQPKYFQYSHYTDEETEAQENFTFAKITLLFISEMGFELM